MPVRTWETHPCVVPNCHALITPGHLACRAHWTSVPQHQRDPLIAAFQRREKDLIAYARACDIARSLVLQYAVLAEGDVSTCDHNVR